MNCLDWQLKVAAELEDPALAEHLSGCEACRGFARDLTENAAALRSIAIDPAAYTAVRSRVLEAVRPRRRFAWLWAAAATAVAACVVLLWWTAPLRSPVPPPPEVTYKPPAPEGIAPLRSRLVTVTSRVRRVRARAHPMPLTAIKLLTDDPNVVIIWLVDKKGD